MADGCDMRLQRFSLRSAGCKALLSSIGVRAMLRAKGETVRSKAAGMYGAKGYGVRIKQGATRARAIVYTADRHAMASNRKHNTLKKASS